MELISIEISKDDFDKLDIPLKVLSTKIDFSGYPEWVEQKKIADKEYKKLKEIESKIAGKWQID